LRRSNPGAARRRAETSRGSAAAPGLLRFARNDGIGSDNAETARVGFIQGDAAGRYELAIRRLIALTAIESRKTSSQSAKSFGLTTSITSNDSAWVYFVNFSYRSSSFFVPACPRVARDDPRRPSRMPLGGAFALAFMERFVRAVSWSPTHGTFERQESRMSFERQFRGAKCRSVAPLSKIRSFLRGLFCMHFFVSASIISRSGSG
jgi:hypothetical protein